MSYQRVLPRDLFNEANLLKCIGRLVLLIEDGKLPGWTYKHAGNAFIIEQDESDGSLSVFNILFYFNGGNVHMRRPLNARGPWPLLADGYDECYVFDDDGNFVLDTE